MHRCIRDVQVGVFVRRALDERAVTEDQLDFVAQVAQERLRHHLDCAGRIDCHPASLFCC
jgi:hypothetical protein